MLTKTNSNVALETNGCFAAGPKLVSPYSATEVPEDVPGGLEIPQNSLAPVRVMASMQRSEHAFPRHT